MDFLKKETKGKSDYTKTIDNHDFISSFGLYETKDFLWIPLKVICLLVLDFMIKKKKKDIYYL